MPIYGQNSDSQALSLWGLDTILLLVTFIHLFPLSHSSNHPSFFAIPNMNLYLKSNAIQNTDDNKRTHKHKSTRRENNFYSVTIIRVDHVFCNYVQFQSVHVCINLIHNIQECLSQATCCAPAAAILCKLGGDFQSLSGSVWTPSLANNETTRTSLRNGQRSCSSSLLTAADTEPTGKI